MHLIAAHPWPTLVDVAAVVFLLGLVLVLTLAGYVFMVLDFHAYLRSLRRALVHVGRMLPEIPNWARSDTPRCIAALGLSLPCNEEDLKRAYRTRVKTLHPDHGGDKRRFLYLQQQFEQALDLVVERRAS